MVEAVNEATKNDFGRIKTVKFLIFLMKIYKKLLSF